jgi:hypothetical protein
MSKGEKLVHTLGIIVFAILAVIVIVAVVFAVCKENEKYPYLEYRHSAYNFDTSNHTFKVQDGYTLNDGHAYDIVETEDGYDIVMHFVKED